MTAKYTVEVLGVRTPNPCRRSIKYVAPLGCNTALGSYFRKHLTHLGLFLVSSLCDTGSRREAEVQGNATARGHGRRMPHIYKSTDFSYTSLTYIRTYPHYPAEANPRCASPAPYVLNATSAYIPLLEFCGLKLYLDDI